MNATGDMYISILPLAGFGCMVILIFMQIRAMNRWFQEARDQLEEALGKKQTFEAFLVALAVLVFPSTAWLGVQNTRIAKVMRDCGAHWRGRIPPVALLLITLIGGLLVTIALAFLDHIISR